MIVRFGLTNNLGSTYPPVINTGNPFMSRSNNFGQGGRIEYCPLPQGVGCYSSMVTFGLPFLVSGYLSSFAPQNWGDNTSIYNQEQFPDATRTITKYVNMVTNNSLPTSTNKEEYFLQKARNNRKGDWDYRWTAQAVNNYYREGFGKKPIGKLKSVEQLVQSMIDNINCASAISIKPESIVSANINALTLGTESFIDTPENNFTQGSSEELKQLDFDPMSYDAVYSVPVSAYVPTEYDPPKTPYDLIDENVVTRPEVLYEQDFTDEFGYAPGETSVPTTQYLIKNISSQTVNIPYNGDIVLLSRGQVFTGDINSFGNLAPMIAAKIIRVSEI